MLPSLDGSTIGLQEVGFVAWAAKHLVSAFLAKGGAYALAPIDALRVPAQVHEHRLLGAL